MLQKTARLVFLGIPKLQLSQLSLLQLRNYFQKHSISKWRKMDISRQWSKCLQVQRNWCREFCRRGRWTWTWCKLLRHGENRAGSQVEARCRPNAIQLCVRGSSIQKYRRIQIQILGGHFITHLLKMTLRLEGYNPGDWGSHFFIISLEVMWCWCLCWWFDWICNRKNNSFTSLRNFLFIFLFESVTIYEKSTVGTGGIFCGLWKADQLKPPQRP